MPDEKTDLLTNLPKPSCPAQDTEPAGWALWRDLLEASFRVERERMLLGRLYCRANGSGGENSQAALQFSKLLLDYVVKMLRDAANETATPALDSRDRR